MFQSGLFAPKRSAPDVIFTATGDFTAMLIARSHIYSYFCRFLGVEVSWTPPYEIKTELIPEPKVRSRNQSFIHLFPPNLGSSARILDKVHPISAVRHISQLN